MPFARAPGIAVASTSAGGPVARSAPAALTLRSLFFAHKGRMIFTYALFNVENILRLAQPWVLGWAINDLLRSSYAGLMMFVAQHLAHLLISSFRQMYDTRAFTGIYSELATRLIVEQREQRVDVSRVAARSALSREYVEFFEHHIPLIMRAFYSIVGALVMLGFYDWMLVPLCLALVLPAALLNAAYGRKTLELSGRLHDDLEREVGVIERGNPTEVREHFDAIADRRVRLSDAEAINFSLMELFVLGLMVVALVHFCTTDGARAGDIFAVFRYVLMFLMGLDSVPRLVHQLSRLRDIGTRLKHPRRPFLMQ
jgi:ABC-type multidrug transport system fused ATPase/permease subunit